MKDANVQEDNNEESAGGDQDSASNKSDVITISGLREDCEKAKEALLDLVPVSEQIPFPHKFHKDLLANKAEILRELTNSTNVQINVPPKEQDHDYIVVSGQRESLEAAKKEIANKLAEIELNNFSVEITEGLKPESIPAFRGRNGAEAERMEKKYKVRIDFSRKDQPDRIVIRGLQKNVQECEQFIRKKLEDEEAKLSETITIDNRIHSRLIGQRGKSLAKITEKFHVEVKFVGRSSDEVIVKGQKQADLDDAIDYLKNLEEEYLQDVTEKDQYVHPSSSSSSNRGGDSNHNSQNGKGFVVRGAPWENGQSSESSAIPDTANMEDFPMISTAPNASTSQKSTWGPRK